MYLSTKQQSWAFSVPFPGTPVAFVLFQARVVFFQKPFGPHSFYRNSFVSYPYIVFAFDACTSWPYCYHLQPSIALVFDALRSLVPSLLVPAMVCCLPGGWMYSLASCV
ncbi:hypothetical protein EDC04DRAFT_2627140, partial [Pisolithus marmoratus]